MQNKRTFHASRIFALLATTCLIALAGCKSTPYVTNLTAPVFNSNPSNIYTFSARIKPVSTSLPESVNVQIIIDGQAFEMKPSPLGQNIYDFEYQVPAGRTGFRYYYLVNYKTANNGMVTARTEYTPLQEASIVGRSIMTLTTNRGPVGARASIVGRGFTSSDQIYFDDTLVHSIYDSPTSISFYVPSLETNRNYSVSVGSAPGAMPAGTFRIDAGGGSYGTATTLGAATTTAPSYTAPSSYTATPTYTQTAPSFGSSSDSVSLTVVPTSIRLKQGESIELTFYSSTTASGSPALIDVTTDVADSVIMPEVFIPVGSNKVTVTIQGGQPGTGYLYAQGPGSSRKLTIPITVTSR